jgi:hypothetical protein
MTANHSSGNTDLDLIRYIDGELDASDRERVEAMLAVDRTLADRFAVLERRSRNLAALLATADPSAHETEAARPARDAVDAPRQATATPATPLSSNLEVSDGVVSIDEVRTRRPARRSPVMTHGWLRAAAIVLVLIGGAMAVAPVRAWIVDALQRLMGSESVMPAPDPAVVPAPPGDPFAFTFDLTGTVIAIEIDHVQASGTLTIRQADVARPGAEIRAGNAEEGFVVLPSGLRITNSATSTASYVIVVPPTITRATLRIAGASPATYALDRIGSEHVVDLTESPPDGRGSPRPGR